jgi:hypothetical protein
MTRVVFPDRMNGWMMTPDGYTLKSTDGGSTWRDAPRTDYLWPNPQHAANDLHFMDANNGYILCDDGRFYRTADAGVTWTSETLSQTPGYYCSLKDMVVNTRARGWIGGSSISIMGDPAVFQVTGTGYSTFTAQSTGATWHNLWSLACHDGVNAWGMGDFGFAAKYSAPTTATCVAPAYLPDADTGEAYSSQLSLTDPFDGPTTWSLAEGYLPEGLALTTGGLIQGTPAWAGVFRFTVAADSPENSIGHVYYLTVINGQSDVSIQTTSLPAGKVGEEYAFSLSGSGGISPYVWTLVKGNLPPGLLLARDGLIGGRAKTPGVYRFRVRANDSRQPPGADEIEMAIVITEDWRTNAAHLLLY